MEEAPSLPKPGEVLAGKYELVRFVGKGGMGVVYEAQHLRLRQRVAIKVLKPDLLAHSDCLTRFDREARAAARMTCPNVARIFDVDRTLSGIPYMVIEFLEGHDLSQELMQRQTLPTGEAVDIILQACSAMSEAHALGVVHRDLKPANLFLCDRGQVKVLDFGISKVFFEEEVSQTTTPSLALGTPHYMSPEQIVSSRDVDPRSDIWSLGVILYKAITGRFPFVGESSTALIVAIATKSPSPITGSEDVPEGLAAATMKALAKDRIARWQRVEDFARAIEPFGTGNFAFASPQDLASVPSSRRAQARDQIATVLDRSSASLVADPIPTEGNWTQPAGVPKRKRWRARALALFAMALAAAGAFGIMRYERSKAEPPNIVTAPPPAETPIPPPSPPSWSAAALTAPSPPSPPVKPPAEPRRTIRRPPPAPPPPPSPPPPAPPAAATAPPKDPLHL